MVSLSNHEADAPITSSFDRLRMRTGFEAFVSISSW